MFYLKASKILLTHSQRSDTIIRVDELYEFGRKPGLGSCHTGGTAEPETIARRA
jgi:hypothetical protein